MAKKKKKRNYNNFEFGYYQGFYWVSNIHVSQVNFRSTTKSGLMRKLNNYLTGINQ
jgi:hypothetical protein